MSERIPCVQVQIPPEACHIWFGDKQKPDHSEILTYKTHRGEELILDFNAQGQVIGIELLGDKPCQRTP